MRISTYFFIPLCLLLSLYSCTSSKEINKAEESWSLELIKGGCMDVCSSYSFLIQNNAQYKYRGMFKVKHLGEKTGELNKDDLEQLILLINAVEWKNLNQNYGTQSNGSQRKELNYISKTVDKKVVYYRLETQEMRTLEQFIDQIINHDEF